MVSAYKTHAKWISFTLGNTWRLINVPEEPDKLVLSPPRSLTAQDLDEAEGERSARSLLPLLPSGSSFPPSRGLSCPENELRTHHLPSYTLSPRNHRILPILKGQSRAVEPTPEGQLSSPFLSLYSPPFPLPKPDSPLSESSRRKQRLG